MKSTIRNSHVVPAMHLLMLVFVGACGESTQHQETANACAATSGDVVVTGLTTEHLDRPLGIDVLAPRLAWQLEAERRGVSQTAYEIQVASRTDVLAAGAADVWSSGKVTSTQTFDVPYAGRPLAARTRYFWKARVWDDAGRVSAWSAGSWFETAVFDPTTWTGQWIGRVPTSVAVPNSERPEPLLRKTFTIDKVVGSARIYISGLGYYKLFVNGNRIGDHELDPAFTVYDHTVRYITYDVTEQLNRGNNAIGVSLGRGFYATKTDGITYNWYQSPWSSDPKLLLELDIHFTDGSTQRVVSDSSWKAADGPTTRDSVWLGEVYDARLEQPGWNTAAFDDSGWDAAVLAVPPAGALRAQMLPPITVTATTKPQTVLTPKDGVLVYDFGSPTAGWAKVMLQGAAGTQVTLSYGEKLLADGTVQHTGGVAVPDDLLQVDTYTLRGGGPESWEPSYSYKGYRYVQIEASPALPEIVEVVAQSVHTSVTSVGDFDSSSDLFNRMHDGMRRTILSNLHSIPTDTPMYEKSGWTADGHLYADAAIRNFDMQNFYENWMNDFRDAQGANGTLGVIIPTPASRTLGFTANDPVWSGAFILINWDLWTYYGDEQELARNYEPMKAYLDRVATTIEPTGYIWRLFSFGDWVAPGGSFAPEGSSLTATAFVYEEARTLADIARALGHDDDGQHYDALADRVAQAFNAAFFDAAADTYYDKRAAGYRQTSNLLPLSLGLVPAGREQAVLDNLVHDVVETHDKHLNTGAIGTQRLLPLLTDNGYGNVAWDVATNPTYPGWGYWYETLGATTMWEYWEETSRSRQHAFLGTIDDWFFTRLAGIEPTAPAFRTIRIKPHPIGDLESASAHQTTPLGQVSSSWWRTGSQFALDVVVPPGATAEVGLPASDPAKVAEIAAGERRPAEQACGVSLVGTDAERVIYRVASGRYQFRVGN